MILAVTPSAAANSTPICGRRPQGQSRRLRRPAARLFGALEAGGVELVGPCRDFFSELGLRDQKIELLLRPHRHSRGEASPARRKLPRSSRPPRASKDQPNRPNSIHLPIMCFACSPEVSDLHKSIFSNPVRETLSQRPVRLAEQRSAVAANETDFLHEGLQGADAEA